MPFTDSIASCHFMRAFLIIISIIVAVSSVALYGSKKESESIRDVGTISSDLIISIDGSRFLTAEERLGDQQNQTEVKSNIIKLKFKTDMFHGNFPQVYKSPVSSTYASGLSAEGNREFDLISSLSWTFYKNKDKAIKCLNKNMLKSDHEKMFNGGSANIFISEFYDKYLNTNEISSKLNYNRYDNASVIYLPSSIDKKLTLESPDAVNFTSIAMSAQSISATYSIIVFCNFYYIIDDRFDSSTTNELLKSGHLREVIMEFGEIDRIKLSAFISEGITFSESIAVKYHYKKIGFEKPRFLKVSFIINYGEYVVREDEAVKSLMQSDISEKKSKVVIKQ